MTSAPIQICSKCHQRAASLKALFRHFSEWHSHDGDWRCSLEGCARTFRVYASFKTHVKRHHHELVYGKQRLDNDPVSSVDCAGPSTAPIPEPASPTSFAPSVSSTSLEGDGLPLPNASCSQRSPADQLSVLLLKWKERLKLPESTLNEIANDIIQYIDTFKDQLHSINSHDLDSLSTKRQREKYWRSLCDYVTPVTVPLSTADGQCRNEAFEYVPICDVIAALMKAQGITEPEDAGQNCSILRDFSDGSYFCNHPFFKDEANRGCIIQLYFDEFEVCNPIGSKRGTHKLLAGYFTLLNRPVWCRSKQNDKHLVLLVRSSLASKHGLAKIMEPLICDVKKLELDGIHVCGQNLRGSVLFVCGDNLSSHQIGGFRECFSSGLICRFCMATRDDIGDKWQEQEYLLRTVESHARHVLLVKSDPSLSRVYGVCGESCLSGLSTFDATCSLPPDIMHDLFEGVVPFVLKHVIKQLVSDGIISLAVLNERLDQFPFQGSDKKSRPPNISRASIYGSASIKGSASEKWCLLRFFSFLVGDLVPPDNAAYSAYVSLRSVVDMVAAPQITTEIVPYLQVEISGFYECFRDAFPNVNCIPKMHFMIHYPRLILMYGPLVRLSSMRFEAKHQYFKSVVKRTNNFINVCRSLSLRHQMTQMYHLAHPEGEVSTLGSKPVTFSVLPELVQQKLDVLGMSSLGMSIVESLTVMGRTFEKGCVLPVKVNDDEMPEFAKVTHIVVCGRRFFVHVRLLRTLLFDEHFHAFVVAYTSNMSIIDDCNHYRQFHNLLCLYKLGNKLYVNPRYEMITGETCHNPGDKV